MQLYVLDRSKNVLATTASFYNDRHHQELTAGASTFQFDVSKSDPAAKYMVSGNYINMLDDQGRPWSFTILNYDEYQTYKTIFCNDVGIELINKATDIWNYTDPHPFSFYFDLITKNTNWELGINQLDGLSRSLKFDGRSTGLARLLDVLTEFDNAECIFNITMHGPVPVKYVVDVYKKIGTVQSNIQIVYNEELNDIHKQETRLDFVTALAGIGSAIENTDENADPNAPQQYVDFSNLVYDDGDFYTNAGDKFLRARTANKKFNPGDQGFVEAFYEYDTSTSQELFNRTLTQIQTRSQPQFTYEADVQVIDPRLQLGDTVTMIDHDYNPALYLSARVATLEKSYTDLTQGMITFTNYQVLTSNIDAQIAALKSKVNGIKNGSSSYVWIRYADDDQGTGISQSPKDKTYVAILAKVNQPVPSDDPKDYAGRWVRIAGKDGLNGQAGPQGKDGSQGIPGKNGADGKTSYTHIAYANSATGEGFSEQPAGKTFIGMYVDFEATDSTDVTKYNWSLIKGADGANGKDGVPGKAGIDGKTPYFHIAYATSADGKVGFSTTDSANKPYLGTYTDYTQADSLDPTAYLWSQIKGETGANGKDGQGAYLHIAYANSVDGKTGFTTDQNQAHNRDYLGTYSDNTKAQSTDPTKYTWQLTRGAQGLQGQPGSKDVPVVTMSSTAPSSPKNGDFWYQTTTDASGQKITGFSVYSNGKWVPSKIDQSTLVLTKLVSVEIDSATINSPDITVPFDFFDELPTEYKGSMEFKDGTLKHISTITGGGMFKTAITPTGYSLNAYNNQTEYTKSNPYLRTDMSVGNLSFYNANMKKAGFLDSSGISGTLNTYTDNSVNIDMNWDEVYKYLSERNQRGYSWFDMMSSVQSHPNLLHNSTLISGTTNWGLSGNTYGTNATHDGNFAVTLDSKGGGNWFFQDLNHIPNAGSQICVSFWSNVVKNDGGVNGGVLIEFNGANKSYVLNLTNANSGWQYYTFDPIDVPNGTTGIRFNFFNNEHSGTQVYFAQPMLNVGSHIWPYMPTY